ncbi:MULTISPECIES: hemin uptake protein HemP [Xanthobacter]|uniref:hemin uptake protein HemP n=1 Tax=Xanthobacter TaxID=279 RepID=UPI001F345C65|nr:MULTISPECIES: hemin uptake protein HemP [unclassified Xanthobacter]
MTKQDYLQATWSADRSSAEGWAGGAISSARAIPMVDAQLDSRDLFAAGRLITIAHGDQTYQLRLTAQNKLILTK